MGLKSGTGLPDQGTGGSKRALQPQFEHFLGVLAIWGSQACDRPEDPVVPFGDSLQAAFLRELLRMASQQSCTSLMEGLMVGLVQELYIGMTGRDL